MAIHSLHPGTHETGLADDCPRCAQHAEHPFASLDDSNLRALAERTKRWMNDEPDAFPRSDNETKAMRSMESAIAAARTLSRLRVALFASPDEVWAVLGGDTLYSTWTTLEEAEEVAERDRSLIEKFGPARVERRVAQLRSAD